MDQKYIQEMLESGTFFGELGMWAESLGTLHTDIYGLSSATAVWVSPVTAMAYPDMLTAHPVWGFMHIERRTVSLEYGFCRTTCEYAGFEGEPLPVTEWSTGVSEEPIETHPNFESFAGTPSHPLNNALFLDADGAISAVDGVGIFSKFVFQPGVSGNDSFAGITSYLNPVLVKKVTSLSRAALIVESAGVGHLDGNLLKTGASSTQRGIVFQNTEEWRGPGRRGWNPSIYSG